MKSVLRPLSLLVLSAFGLTLLVGCSQQEQNTIKVQANLKQALYYAQLNQTPQARQWADRAIAVDPSALSTYVPTAADDSDDDALSIAAVFAASGDDPTLVTYIQQAAKQHPDAFQPLAILDGAQGRLGDVTGQRTTATTLAALLEKKMVTPSNASDKDLQMALAQAYCDAGNLVKGAADYQSVIHTFPAEVMAADNNLAYAYAVADSKPDLPQALQLARQAIQMAIKANKSEEEIGTYQDTLGWVQYRQGIYKDAQDNIQAAVDADPRIAEERYHLGMVDEALHQPDAARAEFTHAALLSQGYKAPQIELSRLKESAPPPAQATRPAETAQR